MMKRKRAQRKMMRKKVKMKVDQGGLKVKERDKTKLWKLG